jgi:hypothetical protein
MSGGTRHSFIGDEAFSPIGDDLMQSSYSSFTHIGASTTAVNADTDNVCDDVKSDTPLPFAPREFRAFSAESGILHPRPFSIT